MSQHAVQDILEMIDQLSEPDRAILDRRLAERAEAAWERELDSARQQAEARGIDQAAIDEAVRKHRYGS